MNTDIARQIEGAERQIRTKATGQLTIYYYIALSKTGYNLPSLASEPLAALLEKTAHPPGPLPLRPLASRLHACGGLGWDKTQKGILNQ